MRQCSIWVTLLERRRRDGCIEVCGMTEDERVTIRLECLHMASKATGEDVAYDYVLEAARKFLDFVLAKKADLKVVSSNDDGMAP